MALNEQQATMVMSQSVETIKKYISDGLLQFPADLIKYKDNPKFKAIEKELSNIPQQEAVARWKEIEGIPAEDVKLRVTSLNEFIARYGSYPGNGEMVNKARALVSSLTADVERVDWENVNQESITSLLGHRRKYPSTSHEVEIDNRVWELTDTSNINHINRYINEFKNGLHRTEAQEMIGALELWKGVSTDPDLVTLSDYIAEEPTSPFMGRALELREKLKWEELQKMVDNPAGYNTEFLKLLVKEEIFTKEELIENWVCTEATYEKLVNPGKEIKLEQKTDENPNILLGSTDVFLFGIPSSGKTCVLTGLVDSTNFMYDSATIGQGGNYANNLVSLKRSMRAPARTKGNFVVQIPGTIFMNESETTYSINLIEMSGEEFANKMVMNPDNIIDFEDLGSGGTKILTSNNKKIIFIVIDPTANGLLTLSAEARDGSTVTSTVEQDMVINKMVNMLERNPRVLKNVNAIHFIMTKSDTLGNRNERDEIAVERIKRLYGKTILRLRDICSQYSINKSTDYQPSLFTFSLGKFYVGNYYEYDPYDSDKLIRIITSMAHGTKKKGFFNSIQKKMN